MNIMEEKSEPPLTNFIVIGKTGAGKSTFVNQFLPHDAANKALVGASLTSVTCNTTCYTAVIAEKKVGLWDTIGLCDTNGRSEEIIMGISAIVAGNAPVAGVVYIFNGRLTVEEIHLFRFSMRVFFGDDKPSIPWNRVLIVHSNDNSWKDREGHARTQAEAAEYLGQHLKECRWRNVDFSENTEENVIQATAIREHLASMMGMEPMRFDSELIKTNVGELHALANSIVLLDKARQEAKVKEDDFNMQIKRLEVSKHTNQDTIMKILQQITILQEEQKRLRQETEKSRQQDQVIRTNVGEHVRKKKGRFLPGLATLPGVAGAVGGLISKGITRLTGGCVVM